MPPKERVEATDDMGQPTPGVLFELLWETMTDVLGTAATATLLRRALKRAISRHHDLSGLVIERNGFGYEYRLPDAWLEARGGQTLHGLEELVKDLQPLLEEMTGPVLARRLARVEPLRQLGIFADKESTR